MLSFDRDGAQIFGARSRTISMSRWGAGHVPENAAGVRIRDVPGLEPFLARDGPIGRIAASAIGSPARAVCAVLFNKTANTNWSMAWHQDRTICVRRKIETLGFGPWTVKSGMRHVAPPFQLLAGMATLRAHLDDVPADNVPLLIAPGSRGKGRVLVSGIEEVVRECGIRSLLADAGDVWLYSILILHASEAAARSTRRRVLQVDFSADELSGGLEWLGV